MVDKAVWGVDENGNPLYRVNLTLDEIMTVLEYLDTTAADSEEDAQFRASIRVKMEKMLANARNSSS